MKLIVCVFVIIINIGDNGRAIDNYLTTKNFDVFGVRDNLNSELCNRPCKINEKPKRCHYIFKVEPFLKDSRQTIAINESVPGPPIIVCLNDVIVVEVNNKIPGQDLAIHWHGIEQAGTPFMDGVPMVTQCPIIYGSTYKYAFRASKPGTFFYHAYSVSHHIDGVYGALNVNQPSPFEPHSPLYDYDRSQENTLLMSTVFTKLFTASLGDLKEIRPIGIEINGQNNYKIFLMEGYTYRLRLINAIAIDCPLTVSIDYHELTIIATDGSNVKPVVVKKVLLYPDERMDVVVHANQQPGGYWIHVRGLEECQGLHARAVIVYSGVNYTSMVPDVQTSMESIVNGKEITSGQKLKSLQDNTNVNVSADPIYLIIDRVFNDFKENENDFRYISDAMPQKTFFPYVMSTKGVVQINGKNFLYPNTPILIQPKDVSKNSICLVGSENNSASPQCVQVIEGSLNSVLELILINEGKYSNDSYTFHIHGLKMQVLGTSKIHFDKPFSKENFVALEKIKQIKRNFINPPIKDTISVPNKGFTIARVNLENPGAWMLECGNCGLAALPTAILINVKHSIPKSIINSLPKCGNYRPPDVLLN